MTYSGSVVHWRWTWWLCAWALAALGCGTRGKEPALDAGVKQGPDADGGGQAGVGGGGKTGGAGGRGGGDSDCVVDFPCLGREARCAGSHQLQPYTEEGCHALCGSRPCHESRCAPSGDIVDCPDGKVCRERRIASGTTTAECVDPTPGECDDELDGGAPYDAGCGIVWGCGDGVPDQFEACDDGNRGDDDGCDRNCQLEEGYDCVTFAGACAPQYFGDRDCVSSACTQSDRCVELATGLACRCIESGLEACPAFSLQSLPMPDRFNRWKPRAVSRDGRAVGGFLEGGTEAPYAAVLWSRETGSRVPVEFLEIVSLSDDGSRQLLSGTALSADGSLTLLLEGDRFVPLQGDLVLLSPTDMDDAASTIAGYFTDQVAGRQRAFRWRDGQTQVLPEVPLASCPSQDCDAVAAAISGDGNTVVGSLSERAFRWRGDDVELLGMDVSGAPSFTNSTAVDVSHDGRYTLGWGNDGSGRAGRALRWDERGELQAIPLPNARATIAWITPTAISGDGRVIVGNLRPEPRDRPRPWIWDDVRGARELEQALVGAPDLENWRLFTADALSTDGQFVVGTAAHRGRAVGYIARVTRE